MFSFNLTKQASRRTFLPQRVRGKLAVLLFAVGFENDQLAKDVKVGRAHPKNSTGFGVVAATGNWSAEGWVQVMIAVVQQGACGIDGLLQANLLCPPNTQAPLSSNSTLLPNYPLLVGLCSSLSAETMFMSSDATIVSGPQTNFTYNTLNINLSCLAMPNSTRPAATEMTDDEVKDLRYLIRKQGKWGADGVLKGPRGQFVDRLAQEQEEER